ncbi:hypothetical protein PG996_005593 [Apiospora saccharicola]|uniref:Myb-like domain-containing protein n=1 Tax=Apiospora saccharicola TaxID=335842 RepID=A0ABR1VPU0_9PEZI
MPPKKNTENGDAGAAGISGVNWKLVDAVFKFCPASSKPNIDWNALAQITGHKNGKSARDSFRAACAKFGWFEAAGDNSAAAAAPGSAPKSTKATNARKKKAAPTKDVSDDVSDDEVETPTKKRKGGATNGLETPLKKTKLTKDEVEGEAEEENKEETTETMDVAQDEHADDEV